MKLSLSSPMPFRRAYWALLGIAAGALAATACGEEARTCSGKDCAGSAPATVDGGNGGAPEPGEGSENPPPPPPDAGGKPPDGEPSEDAGTPPAGDAGAPDPDAGAPSEDGGPGPLPGTLNGWQVEVDAESWRIVPPHGGPAVISGPSACAAEDAAPAATAKGNPSANFSVGAFQISLDPPQAKMRWTNHCGAPEIVRDGSGTEIRWAADDGQHVALRFEPYGEENLWVGLSPSWAPSAAALSWACAPGEAFFGLGTQATGMDLRGRRYPLWTQEQGISKPEGGGVFPLNNIPEAAYAPMGIWHSSAGYAAIIGHDGYSEIDLCKTDSARVTLRSYQETPSFVLVAGETPAERLRRITAYTGRSAAPPDWVFAPWNDAVGGPARIAEITAILRTEGIPSSAIWSEDWIGGEQTATGFRLSYAWEWDPARYPDLPAAITSLHTQGFAFLAYFNTFVPQPTRMFKEGTAGGFLVKNAEGAPYLFTDPAFRQAGLADLSNPKAVAWLKGYLRTAAADLAIDGWMADFAEWLPHDAVTFNGETGWQAHNRYPIAWQRTNREVFEEVHSGLPPPENNNWTFFARSGWASVNGGTAGATAAMWGGDQNTDWGLDDGLPTVIPIAVHAGLGGVSLFATDIAGYTSVTVPHTTKELFLRWTVLGAFHPIMRTHHGSDECGNWQFERDAETLAHYRRFARIHTVLLPMWRKWVAESVNDGLPIMRHPYLVEPSDEDFWRGAGYTYFLGRELLVHPIITGGAADVEVRLPFAGPAAAWWPLFGQTSGENPRRDGLGVFARPGTVLELLAVAPDTFYPGAGSAAATTLEAVAHLRRLALYPHANGDAGATLEGGGTVTASGIAAAAFAQPGLSWNGGELPPCPAEEVPAADCADTTTGIAWVSGAGELTSPAGLSVRIDGGGSEERRYAIGIGAAAWGELAKPTPITDLNPDIPPPCEQP